MLVVIAILTKKTQGRYRHEFPPSSVLRAEHQVGLGESTTFENENWVASQPKSLADTAIGPGHVRFTPKSGHSPMRLRCPLCAKSRHKAAQLFDHLVGRSKQRLRDIEAERFSSFAVDHQLKLRWLLDRQFLGFRTLENAVDVACR